MIPKIYYVAHAPISRGDHSLHCRWFMLIKGNLFGSSYDINLLRRPWDEILIDLKKTLPLLTKEAKEVYEQYKNTKLEIGKSDIGRIPIPFFETEIELMTHSISLIEKYKDELLSNNWSFVPC